MREDLVSIIIPVYNVEKYVEKCLQSVKLQTYKNIQVLMIDDGSTDGSAEICKEFELADKRFKYYYKQNGGLSDARNFGIDKANGKLLTFVDSDDYLNKYFIERLYACFNDNQDVEVSVCAMEMVDETYNTIGIEKLPANLYSGKEALKEVLYSRGLECYACAKMFNAKIFEEFRFTKGRLFEDLDLIYKILLNVKSVKVVSEAYYYYLQRQSSITQMVFNKKQLVLLDIINELQECILLKTPTLATAVTRRKVCAELWLIAKIYTSKEKDKMLIKQLTNGVKADAKIVLKDKEASVKDRIKIYLLKYFGPRVFSFIYNRVGTGAR